MFKTQFRTRRLDIGVSLEEKIRKASANNQPNESISPMIYTNSKDGVLPQFDIRSDRFDIALDAVDNYQASDVASTDGLNIDTDKDLKEYVETSNEED